VGLRDVLNLAARFRERNTRTPIVLMGYANPVEAMGVSVFVGRAREAGVDGVIVVDYPPEDTRAYFRGRCLQQYPEAVAAASWDSVIFDIPGRESLQRVPTLEPLRGTRAHVGDLLDRCETAAELVAALTGQD